MPAELWPVLVSLSLLLTGMTMTWPVGDVFLADLLGKGDAARWKGIHVGISAATGFVLTPLVGSASDHIGRKPALLWCYLLFVLCTVASLIGVLLRSIAWLTAGRVHSLGLLLVVTKACVADVTEGACQVRCLGIFAGAFAFALVCGPGIGAAIGNRGTEWIYAASCVASVLALATASSATAVQSRMQRGGAGHRHRPASGAQSLTQWRGALRRLAADRMLLGAVVCFALIKLCSLHTVTSLSLYVQHRYGWKAKELGILMASAGLSIGLVNIIGSRVIARRTGWHLPIIFAGAAWAAPANILYGVAVDPWLLIATLVLGQPAGLLGPVADMKVAAMAGNEAGFALGCINSLQSLLEIGTLPLFGEILGTAIDNHKDEPRALGVGLPFFVNAPLCVLSALALYWCHYRYGRHRPEWTGRPPDTSVARAAYAENIVDGALAALADSPEEGTVV